MERLVTNQTYVVRPANFSYAAEYENCDTVHPVFWRRPTRNTLRHALSSTAAPRRHIEDRSHHFPCPAAPRRAFTSRTSPTPTGPVPLQSLYFKRAQKLMAAG